ncbi:MAG: hypothetical protein L0J35_06490 [Tetragenococcus halophilus]|nr:hypothetical protein [Tetragenococcus halophilus]MDN6631130.1 hypothetical protein [Staphylococcus equorum]
MEKENKLIAMTKEMVKEVEKFQKENFISTFTAAVIELVRRGLKYKE